MKTLIFLFTLFLLVGCSQTTTISSGKTLVSTGTEQKSSMDSKEVQKYTIYQESLAKQAAKEGKNVYFFFHANWCPSCRLLDKEIQNTLSSIPENTLIMKVDYDSSSTDMKKQYTVTTQHTVVRVGPNLELISKKIGPRTISEILQ